MPENIYSRMLSIPLQIEWAGWRTDTLKLQQAGWSLSADQDVMSDTMRIAMEHKNLQMRAISHRIDFRYKQLLHGDGPGSYDWMRAMVLPMHMIGREVHIHEQGPIDWSTFKPIDATPTFVQHRIGKLQDLVHFAPAQVKTKELIIPQENVEELMERILKLQDPARIARIREDIRNPEGITLDGIDKMHGKQRFEAQIISMAA